MDYSLLEVDGLFRDKGQISNSNYWQVPAQCYVDKRDFVADFEAEKLKLEPAELQLADENLIWADVFRSEYPCKEFTEWHRGASPKEHREMVDRDRLLEREHAWHQDDLKIQNDMVRYSRQAAIAQGASAFATAIAIAVGVVVALVISAQDSSVNVSVSLPTLEITATPDSP